MKAVDLFVTVILIVAVVHSVDALSIDSVLIANPGNAVDDTGFGAVAYDYRIGKYEVTNSQYVEFLNGVDPTGSNTLALYKSDMSSSPSGGIEFDGGAVDGAKYSIKSGRNDNPVAFVSRFDALRFVNWLSNGQDGGDTETGAYTLLGGTPTPINGIVRNPGANWFLPSEDEWYKAAYHKNDGATGNYWEYPTSTDTQPFSDEPPGSGAPIQSSTANFFKNDLTANGYNDGYAVTGSTIFVNGLTDVGAYAASVSPYGTFDQAGNVYEWFDTSSILRGGAFLEGDSDSLPASVRWSAFSGIDGDFRNGFRVATMVPEPSTLLLGTLASVGLLVRRRAKQ